MIHGEEPWVHRVGSEKFLVFSPCVTLLLITRINIHVYTKFVEIQHIQSKWYKEKYYYEILRSNSWQYFSVFGTETPLFW